MLPNACNISYIYYMFKKKSRQVYSITVTSVIQKSQNICQLQNNNIVVCLYNLIY
uniref:Uncharacterized protein n=1 Tax=Anguilla anguilla TaxID=7936 RepID=A0A0E9QPL2_ANGAN